MRCHISLYTNSQNKIERNERIYPVFWHKTVSLKCNWSLNFGSNLITQRKFLITQRNFLISSYKKQNNGTYRELT